MILIDELYKRKRVIFSLNGGGKITNNGIYLNLHSSNDQIKNRMINYKTKYPIRTMIYTVMYLILDLSYKKSNIFINNGVKSTSLTSLIENPSLFLFKKRDWNKMKKAKYIITILPRRTITKDNVFGIEDHIGSKIEIFLKRFQKMLFKIPIQDNYAKKIERLLEIRL